MQQSRSRSQTAHRSVDAPPQVVHPLSRRHRHWLRHPAQPPTYQPNHHIPTGSPPPPIPRPSPRHRDRSTLANGSQSHPNSQWDSYTQSVAESALSFRPPTAGFREMVLFSSAAYTKIENKKHPGAQFWRGIRIDRPRGEHATSGSVSRGILYDSCIQGPL